MNLKLTKPRHHKLLSQSILENPYKFNVDLKTEDFTPAVDPLVKILTINMKVV